MKSLLRAMVAIVVLVGTGYFWGTHVAGQQQRDDGAVASADPEFEQLVVTLRENRNRLEVHRLGGKVTTRANTLGGWGNILSADMVVKQPFSVSYFTNMGDLTLDDYVWEPATRTLIVRAPIATPDQPNIDESKREVSYSGPVITRDMQTNLNRAVAGHAVKQVSDEAAKPENMEAAMRASRLAITRNLEAPLKAAGLKDIKVVVRTPVDGDRNNREYWDVSRSIADVLAERARG